MSCGLVPAVVHLVVRLLYSTLRIRVIGREIPRSFHERKEGTIFVFWHSRLLMCPFAYRGTNLHVLISSHGDGELIADVMEGFGFRLVRGSSSKGGTEALREMVRLGRKNADIAITPDGPRGPAEVVKSGVAHLARITGRAVLPLSFASSRSRRFDSWDRFLLPYPFSRGVFVWGEPLYYREGEATEAFRLRIEEALRDTTARADECASSKFKVHGSGY
ncbi:MAG TPA: lysophospholipid acyltransferase family protein [Geobacteraceae bacterium]|nr:lysophospholipid acyltransferase family protein [Geobacteraceae bacterium]